MKKTATIIILSILFSCHDDQSTSGGFISVKRNGAEWNGDPDITLEPGTDTLTLMGIANHPNDEVLAMKVKFNGAGNYTLTKNQAYYYSTVGGDVLTSRYVLDQHATGQLIISKYEQGTDLIEGTFNFTLDKSMSSPDNGIDTYIFTQGKFRGMITRYHAK